MHSTEESLSACREEGCRCVEFSPMTLSRVDARKHTLEADVMRNPEKDYSDEWERLATMYLLLSGEKSPNHYYCLSRVKKDSDGIYPWQDWTDK